MVYNLLPEIVARLPEHVEPGVEGGAVARVQYIMQFVEKARMGRSTGEGEKTTTPSQKFFFLSWFEA